MKPIPFLVPTTVLIVCCTSAVVSGTPVRGSSDIAKTSGFHTSFGSESTPGTFVYPDSLENIDLNDENPVSIPQSVKKYGHKQMKASFEVTKAERKVKDAQLLLTEMLKHNQPVQVNIINEQVEAMFQIVEVEKKVIDAQYRLIAAQKKEKILNDAIKESSNISQRDVDAMCINETASEVTKAERKPVSIPQALKKYGRKQMKASFEVTKAERKVKHAQFLLTEMPKHNLRKRIDPTYEINRADKNAHLAVEAEHINVQLKAMFEIEEVGRKLIDAQYRLIAAQKKEKILNDANKVLSH